MTAEPSPSLPDDDTRSTESRRTDDRAYHLARVVAALPTTVRDPARAARLAQLLKRAQCHDPESS